MTERINWIDTCKGLLICLVLVSHISSIGCATGIDMPALNRMGGITLLYKCFYMSLFFILNAYTTNYNVDLLPFIWKRFKTLMIPAFAFSVITSVINSLVINGSLYPQSLFSLSFFTHFGVYWFLPALFGSNVLFILLYKYVFMRYHPSILIETIIMLSISIFGVVLSLYYNNDSNKCNPLYYRYILFYVIFVYAGFKAKSFSMPKSVYLIVSVIYIVPICACIFCNVSIPQYTGWISCTPIQIPFLYFLAFSGSIMLVLFSKLIDNSKLFEFIGRNSLVIYLVHSTILIALFEFAVSINYQSLATIAQIAFLVGVFVITLGLSLIISRFFSLKYARVLIGKF